MELSVAERTVIITLKRENKKNSEIIEHLWQHYGRKIDRRTVQRTWARVKETGNLSNRARSGRKRKCDVRGERRIRRLAISNRFDTFPHLVGKVKENLSIKMSRQTLSRTLKKHALSRYVAKKCPLLSRAQRKRRLEWARAYSKWPISNWSRVLFSDEKIFRSCSTRKGLLVTRRPSERSRQ